MILSVIGGSPFLLYSIKTNKDILYSRYYLKKITVQRSSKCNSCLWWGFRRVTKSWIYFLHWKRRNMEGRNMLFLRAQVHTVRPTLIIIFSGEQLHLLQSLKHMVIFGKRLMRSTLKELKAITRPPGTCRRLLKKTFMEKIIFSMGSTSYFS